MFPDQRARAAHEHVRALAGHEHAHDALVEEERELARRLQELERVARGRRVEDDEVVLAALHESKERLGRGVLLHAGDEVAERAVEPVLEDALDFRLVGGEPAHHVLEDHARIEHPRVHHAGALHRAAGRGPASRANRAPRPGGARDRSSAPARGALAARRPGPGRPRWWSCPRRRRRSRRSPAASARARRGRAGRPGAPLAHEKLPSASASEGATRTLVASSPTAITGT